MGLVRSNWSFSITLMNRKRYYCGGSLVITWRTRHPFISLDMWYLDMLQHIEKVLTRCSPPDLYIPVSRLTEQICFYGLKLTPSVISCCSSRKQANHFKQSKIPHIYLNLEIINSTIPSMLFAVPILSISLISLSQWTTLEHILLITPSLLHLQRQSLLLPMTLSTNMSSFLHTTAGLL